MVNAFSFCLYGPTNKRYYPGMLENVYLAGKYFPTWKVYVYYAPDVDESMVHQLSVCNNVVLMPTGITGAGNMIKRFFAIDEPDVDLMMVRDADSRIHWKDRWAIQRFVASPFLAHTIRDHKDHTASMMGGLWGLKKAAGINVRAEYESYVEDMSLGHRNAHDQNFLADVIHPKVLPTLLIHLSRAPVFLGENNVVMFPFEWSSDVYCGRIEYDFADNPEPRSKGLGFLPTTSVSIPKFLPEPSTPTPSSVYEQRFVPVQPTVPVLHFLNKK